MKRKAEDNQETEPTEVMDCMCENANDVNTAEEDDMVHRSRYVAITSMGGPLEGMRLPRSDVAKLSNKLMFIDTSKANLHADVLNDSIHVELPGEMNMPDMCGRLLRALYGTRQAARARKEEYTKTSREQVSIG